MEANKYFQDSFTKKVFSASLQILFNNDGLIKKLK